MYIIFVIITLSLVAVFIMAERILRLKNANKKLNELLTESYEIGKTLVRRDMELSEANRHLVALDENKTEFINVAAHQLRTPLAGIKWAFVELSGKEFGGLNSDQQKIAESGVKAAVRIITLINELLNVARIEEGRFGINLKRQPIIGLLRSVAERTKQVADAKGVLFAVDISPDIPPIKIDEEKIDMALQNTLDNAVKYTPPGGKVTMSASLRKGEEEAGMVEIKISDTGIGIPKEQLERVFTKFFRADNALRMQTYGTGLGLYVVKNIVEKHNGTVGVESNGEKGAIITIILPLG